MENKFCTAVKEYIKDEASDRDKYKKLSEELSGGWKTAVKSISIDEGKHHEMLEGFYKENCG